MIVVGCMLVMIFHELGVDKDVVWLSCCDFMTFEKMG